MEAREKILVKLFVSDRVIHNLSHGIIEIAVGMHNDKDIIIFLNTEGPCLESLTYRVRDNLLGLLDDLCHKMSYDPKRIEIETGNIIEKTKSNFNIKRMNTVDGWFYGEHLQKIKPVQKQLKYHFGNFVSNSTYPRLLLASHLHENHKEKTLQTYRKNPRDPGQAVDLDLDKLMFECADPDVLTGVAKFIKCLPLELEDGLSEHPMTNISAGEDGDAINKNILSWYGEFLCDVVTETFFSGHTFFPTEKTTRPLLSMNPFVVHGPKHYLARLKQLGFKTFSGYWSEEYDHLEGYQRCKAINAVINHIARQDINELYKEMKPILEHNRKTLLELDSNKYGSLLARY